MALSVKPALSEPPRPLAGMLPYGDRTFLPSPIVKMERSDCPSEKPQFIIRFLRTKGNSLKQLSLLMSLCSNRSLCAAGGDGGVFWPKQVKL